MVLNRFCKFMGGVLLLLWLPAGIITLFMLMTVFALYGIDGSPAGLGIIGLLLTVVYLSSLGFILWLFFPGNWLERLIRWLSPDGKRLVLTEIIIDDSAISAPLEPVPVKIVGPIPAATPEEPPHHPDEKYLPPQYRR